MGVPIAVRRSQFPVLPLGEHYWHDLIGLDAVAEDGAPSVGSWMSSRPAPTMYLWLGDAAST